MLLAFSERAFFVLMVGIYFLRSSGEGTERSIACVLPALGLVVAIPSSSLSRENVLRASIDVASCHTYPIVSVEVAVL